MPLLSIYQRLSVSIQQQLAPMNATASRAASAACCCCSTSSTSTSTSSRATTTAARSSSRPFVASSSLSSRSPFAPFCASNSYLRSKRTSHAHHRPAPRAVPELTDALSLAATSASSLVADAISSTSSTSSAPAAAAAAADSSAAAVAAASSLAASIAHYASAAMLTLAELTNEATAAVAAEDTRVAGSLASTSSLPAFDLLASLPVPSIFDPPHPEPANALSLPTWAIHVSSVAEWVVAMNLFWKLGGVPGGVPQWRGMSWGMTPLLGGALCACTFHFFYNSPTLAPLVALQAGLTVVGNATMWIAAWRVFEATKGKREAEDLEKEERKERQA